MGGLPRIKGLEMPRRKSSYTASNRQSLRIALGLILTSGLGSAVGDEFGQIPKQLSGQASGLQVDAELPVYPFPVGVDLKPAMLPAATLPVLAEPRFHSSTSLSATTSRQVSGSLVANGSTGQQKPASLSNSSSRKKVARLLGLSTSVSPAAVANSLPLPVDNPVVPAAAAAPASVEANLSDRDQAQESQQDLIDGLLNSLSVVDVPNSTAEVHAFSDSAPAIEGLIATEDQSASGRLTDNILGHDVNIQAESTDTVVSLNMSDDSQYAEADVQEADVQEANDDSGELRTATLAEALPAALPVPPTTTPPALLTTPAIGQLPSDTSSRSAESSRRSLQPVEMLGNAQPNRLNGLVQADQGNNNSVQPLPSTAQLPVIPPAPEVVTTGSSRRPLQPVEQRIVDGPSVADRQQMNNRVSVAVKETTVLASKQTIQSVSVEKPEICHAILSSGKSVTLVGLQSGETRVALISEVAGRRQVDIHTVTVTSGRSQVASDMNAIAKDISAVVSQLYPRNNLRIFARDSSIVVQGSVDSEETAKRILSLVRKSTLNPVIDDLQSK